LSKKTLELLSEEYPAEDSQGDNAATKKDNRIVQATADALSNLAVCYERGDGVSVDLAQAYAFYLVAADQNEIAKEKLAALKKRLSKEALNEGKQRAEKLQKEINTKIAAKADGK
jgi:TPR repeat protein